jgi:tetratricopeptide (TPR) repeat protein
VNIISIAEQASTALGLALEEPHTAMALAEQARAAATAAGLDAEEAVALRALGLAARALHKITAAAEFLSRAVEAATRAGDADLEAECRVTLASVMVFAGESEDALATLDEASPGPRVTVLVASQRAAILTLLGRYDEALGCYDPLVRSLRRSGDRLLESRVLTNRGLLHVYTGRFHLADIDLARAERLAADLGHLTEAAGYCHNRGFAAARRGDLPEALVLFDRAEQRYREAGVPLGARAFDQAEALLAAGLVRDARDLVERAITAMRAGGDRFALAEGLLLLADCTHLAGDVEASQAAARQAVELFAEQDRPGWSALARAALGRAALGSGTVSVDTAEAASDAAAALDRLGFATRALAAHAVAGKLWLGVGRTAGDPSLSRAQAELATAATGRSRGPAADRAVAWDAEAVRRLAAGNRRGALAALKAAVAVVEAQQAGLSATEMRAHISVHADRSAALGLRLAIESGRPRQIFGWMERRRANSLRSWPLRPPPDPALAHDLAELRRLSGEVASAGTSGGDPRPAARRQTRLERVVRERAWRLGLDSPSGRLDAVPDTDRLVEELGDWALLELADSAGELHAVIVSGRRWYHRHLGPTAAVVGELEHLRFGLRRAVYGMGGDSKAVKGFGEAADRLDHQLFGSVRKLLGDRTVVVVPTGALHAVPWSALRTLAGRPLVVAPSAHAWLRASLTPPPDGPLLGVAGPGLPAAAAEVNALRRFHPAVEILTGRRAIVTAVLARLEGAAVAHIAAHAVLNADNGLWSALQLADGPLTVYELEGLARAPGLVILSACQSGLSTVRPGDEVLGLVAALLALGARTVIASVLPIDDHATAGLMLALHARLAAGDAPAVGLARTQADATDALVAASFVCFGAP